MPELPDLTVYIEALARRLIGQQLTGVRLASPFLVRSVTPPLGELVGQRVTALRRLGKRIAFGFEHGPWLVLHLMIAGRLHWREPGAKLSGRHALAAFDFAPGTLILTEFGPKKRASLHVVAGEAGLADHDPGGLEVLCADLPAFQAALRQDNQTLKRALTDPHRFSGIGNAYSDEILHRAQLSPMALSQQLDAAETARLFAATRATLVEWTERLRAEAGDGFPDKVTAFHSGMAVHGRYREPCPVCGAPVQRLRAKETESNYCARCQTGGRILADRGLAQLLHGRRPRTLDDLVEP